MQLHKNTGSYVKKDTNKMVKGKNAGALDLKTTINNLHHTDQQINMSKATFSEYSALGDETFLMLQHVQ